MGDVKCEVESCAYWSSGNNCAAKSINVINSIAGGARLDAGVIGGKRHASTSAETACETFRPKR